MELRKILKALRIIQEVSNDKRHKEGKKRLGRGYSTALRLNAFNPLSYLTLALVIPIGLLLFGIVGFWGQTDVRNPFKWD